MAKHDVVFTLPERKLGKADIEFRVRRDGKAFGRLRVSNGALVWVEGNKTYGYRMAWNDFHALITERGKKENT